MTNTISLESIYSNLKLLLVKQHFPLEKINLVFNLASSFNDFDTIKILANKYEYEDAISFLEQHENDFEHEDLIDLINYAEYNLIKDLIDSGVYINKKNDNGDTALIRACFLNRVDVVKLLLENKANVQDKLQNKIKLVDFAFQLGYKEILELLISYGADNIYEKYSTNFFFEVDKYISSQFIAKQFVYEELDAAQYGNDDAISFVHKSGVKIADYNDAMKNSLPEVDGEKSPQQILLFNCLMPITNENNRELVTKIRILTVEKVMNKYYLGKYENKLIKLTLNNSIEIFINKDFALIENEKFELIKEQEYYNPKRHYYLNIAYDKVVTFYKKTYDGVSDKEYFEIINRENILKQNIKHNPKRVVEILNYFTKDNPIKYTAHSFNWGRYGTYKNFMKNVRQTFEEIDDDLKFLSPNLYEKIVKFLFSNSLSISNTWGMNRIAFGWSSPELEQWSYIEEAKSNGKKAICFPLPNEYINCINNRTITIFEDVCGIFKNEIEIRDDGKLSMLLEELEDEILGFDFEVEYINLENISFYTDVEYLRNGLIKIFEQFKEKSRITYNCIVIEAITCDEGKYIDLLITQIGSKVNKDSLMMINEIKDGDFQDIRKSFLSLCDWSIISEFHDGFFKIDYLSIEDENVVKNELKVIPDGFTHKLRFYNV